MNKPPQVTGPEIEDEKLVELYRAERNVPTPWTAISDQVMGGVSSAQVHASERGSSECTCLTGRTSLENNGGFVQMKLGIESAHSPGKFRGLFIELCGAAHEYDLRVKTDQLDRPWQSFRCALLVKAQWTRFIIPYAQLQAHRTGATLDPGKIKSIAVVAIGEEFQVDICVRRAGFYL